MNTNGHPVRSDDTSRPAGARDVGDRYLTWLSYTEPGLSAAMKAQGYEAFATEFELIPASAQPYQGWAESLAAACRRLARHHRGEQMGESLHQAC